MKIFHLPKQPDTYIEIDMNYEWTIPETPRFSKCGWTPFSGRKVKGAIRNVVLRGEAVFVDGEIVGSKGFGENVRLSSEVFEHQPRQEAANKHH